MRNPHPPEKVKRRLQQYAARPEPTEFDPKVKGPLIGWLNGAFNGDENRRLALAWLFDHPEPDLSTKQLTPQQWYGIAQWVGSYLDEDIDEWLCREEFPEEAVLVLREALGWQERLQLTGGIEF